MQYDFDTILDRRGRDALALDMIPYNGVEPKEGFSRIRCWRPSGPGWNTRISGIFS